MAKQPRVPAGSSRGGEFASSGAGSSKAAKRAAFMATVPDNKKYLYHTPATKRAAANSAYDARVKSIQASGAKRGLAVNVRLASSMAVGLVKNPYKKK